MALVCRAFLNADRGVQPPIVPDDASGAGEVHDGLGQLVRGRRGAHEEVQLAGLDDAVELRVGVRRAVGMHLEDEIGRASWLEVHPLEADQLPGRARDLRHGVVEVDLHDLVAVALADVGDPHGELHGAVGRDLAWH